MASQRPPSSMGRPVSRSGTVLPGTGRPPSAIRPPSTSIRIGTGMFPGASVRGGTSITPGVLSAPIKVTDRPVTQQGLSGMKTGIKGPQRQILDKSYYLGLLRSKINELTTEMSKLHKEIDNYYQENSVYLSYEKRAEGLAQEIKDLQGQLADYNMLADKLNTNTEIEEMVNEYNIVKAKNDRQAETIDSVFTDRRGVEEAIREIEEDIMREQQATDEVVQAMPATKREEYFTMTATNEELLQELAVLQEELDILIKRKEDYEGEMAHSYMKQEMVQLHETLVVLDAKREAMEAEQKSLMSPQEEREKLFKQVKEDNQEMASMERQLTEIRGRIRQITEEIHQLDQDESQKESQQKYKELKKKEEEIDCYLDSFEESRTQEQEKMTHIQENIVSLLELCSRNMMRLSHVDTISASELRNMQEVLVSKETEVAQSQSTAKGLATETERLQQDLEKVQQLGGKIEVELSSLKERISTMEFELQTYRDLDTLRSTAGHRKKRLQEECESLSERQDFFKQLLEEMNQKYDALKAKLQEYESQVQLPLLETKWQHLEKNNFIMKEYIISRTQESDFNSVAKNVYQQVSEYNKSLIESLQTNKT